MEQRKYNPYIMGKMVFDLNEKRIPAIEEEVNSMRARVTALETPKAISTTPFETGETYKGKPVKKVVIPLNNAAQFDIVSNSIKDLGVGFGSLPVGIVLECNLVNSTNLQQSGGVHFNFYEAIASGGNIKASAGRMFVVDPNAELIIEYIERDPEVSES